MKRIINALVLAAIVSALGVAEVALSPISSLAVAAQKTFVPSMCQESRVQDATGTWRLILDCPSG